MNTSITTAGGTHYVADHIYNGLVGLDDELKPIPELAASWQITEGGKVYTLPPSGYLQSSGQFGYRL